MRPTLRPLFRTADRRPEIFFYTSSDEKFLQARRVFELCGLRLNHFKSRNEPYGEDYSGSTDELLRKGLDEVVGSIGGGSLVFVEDTSIRIDALSPSPDLDFPGLAAKEWFASASFNEVSAELGENRAAIVKSDIALHVPALRQPIYFHGDTVGVLATALPETHTDPQSPWLTTRTFNGWFVPAGADKPLGVMSIDESWDYDFRVKALLSLIDWLEQATAALNLPTSAYRVTRRAPGPPTLSLFPAADDRKFIVLGGTCAGKTTFAERAKSQHDYFTIEASAVMRSFESEIVRNTRETDFEFASRVLQQNGADIVARRVSEFYADELTRPCVISGFRLIEEVLYFKTHFPEVTVVFVDAAPRTRYERFVLRARSGSTVDRSDFDLADAQQAALGLLGVARDVAEVSIRNEESMETYFEQIDSVVSRSERAAEGVTRGATARVRAERSQLIRCLRILDDAARPMSTDEIEKASEGGGVRIRHNNANKVLKRAPALVRRIEGGADRIRYELLGPGRAFLSLAALIWGDQPQEALEGQTVV